MLLEWDFSNTNKAVKVEATKAPYGLGPLRTNSSDSWHNKTRVCCLWLCVSEPQSIQPVTRCTPVNTPSRWWRPERIFSLDKKPNSQDIEKYRRKNLIQFLYRGLTATFVLIGTGLERTVNSPVCEAVSNSRLIGPMPVFCPMVLSSYETWLRRQRQRKTVTISGRKGLRKTETRLLISKNQIFYVTRILLHKYFLLLI